MIRFAPTVRIDWWSYDLTAILLNASMWSNKTKVPVIVHDVRDMPHDEAEHDRYSFTVRLAVEDDTPLHRASLAEYLQKTVPSGFDVIDRGARVDVLYITRARIFWKPLR